MSLKPELFGKFILLDKIAAGGMAEVYRAKAPGLSGIAKIIAIKRILPQYSANSEFIDMFKNEAKIAVNLSQANIATIYEFGEELSLYYLSMEFVDGRNLRQVISRCTKLQKSLTIEHGVYTIAQICTGLDYAHRCTDKNTGNPLNIIHRDMSPQNIMISFEGEVKLVDFGIAKAESRIDSTRAGTLKGKFGYMSPEQAEGLELDWRTDIFSTGIVLWEILTGERLFVANNEINTIKKIRECIIPSPRKINPNISEELDRITMKALAREKNSRYQSASEMSRDLSRYLYKINPEFTAQDLSHFTKLLFKEEILEDRNKVSEFAKIDFARMKKIEQKTNHDSATTITQTDTATDTSQLGKSESNRPPDNFILNTFEKNKDISLVVDAARVRQHLANSQVEIVRRKARSSNTDSEWYGPARSAQEGSLLKWLPAGILLVVLTVGGFTFFKNPTRFFKLGQGAVNSMTASRTEQASVGEEQDSQLSVNPAVPLPLPKIPAAVMPEESGRLTIRSFPAGAEITTIEEGSPEQKRFGTTPSEITLPIRRRVTLRLHRDGYVDTHHEFIVTKPVEALSFTMDKAIYGYVNIDVQPSGSDIYIDGVKLESATNKRIPIPANRSVKITAINHFTGFRDEQVVLVKQDTLKSIYLFPRQSRQ